VILQRLERCIVIGSIIRGEPSSLQEVSICTGDEYNTYLLRDSVLVQDTCNNRSDVCTTMVPLQWRESELVFPERPLIRLAISAVDIVGCDGDIWIVASALGSPRVEGK
jgi:hypothetical protein